MCFIIALDHLLVPIDQILFLEIFINFQSLYLFYPPLFFISNFFPSNPIKQNLYIHCKYEIKKKTMNYITKILNQTSNTNKLLNFQILGNYSDF